MHPHVQAYVLKHIIRLFPVHCGSTSGVVVAATAERQSDTQQQG